MRCLAGQYWFAEICTPEKINTKRQRKFSYCYDNSFDHADPWKGSQEPPEVLGPHFEKHWLRLKSKKFPSLIPQILGTYYVPAAIPGAGNPTTDKTKSCPRAAPVLLGQADCTGINSPCP